MSEPAISMHRHGIVIQVSQELLDDGVFMDYAFSRALGDTQGAMRSLKRILQLGYGEGRQALSCRWPRPTLKQLRVERIRENRYKHECEDDE